MTTVAIYGLGYVGSVTAACLAAEGLTVVGVDIDANKVGFINAGKSPVVEPGVEVLIGNAVADGTLSAQARLDDETAAQIDIHLICVGTPSRPNGALDTTQVEAVASQIAARLGRADKRQVVAFRSTLLPGTVSYELVPLLESVSGLKPGVDFGVAVCPEFLRETTAVTDFQDPPFTIVGASDPQTVIALEDLFDFLPAKLEVTDLGTAETIKYACNAFHAVKVGFANEVGRFAKACGADANRVMDIFCTDDKLNISSAYLRPGFAFGGSCLPKDLRALVYRSRTLDLDLPLLSNVLASNDQHLNAALDMILAIKPNSVCMLGLAFKTGTDDLRESPFVRLCEVLIGKGIDVSIWDPDLDAKRLVGRNRGFVDEHLPHLARLLCSSPSAAIDGADCVVVGTSSAEGLSTLARLGIEANGSLSSPSVQKTVPVIDLVGSFEADNPNLSYEGVAW